MKQENQIQKSPTVCKKGNSSEFLPYFSLKFVSLLLLILNPQFLRMAAAASVNNHSPLSHTDLNHCDNHPNHCDAQSRFLTDSGIAAERMAELDLNELFYKSRTIENSFYQEYIEPLLTNVYLWSLGISAIILKYYFKYRDEQQQPQPLQQTEEQNSTHCPVEVDNRRAIAEAKLNRELAMAHKQSKLAEQRRRMQEIKHLEQIRAEQARLALLQQKKEREECERAEIAREEMEHKQLEQLRIQTRIMNLQARKRAKECKSIADVLQRYNDASYRGTVTCIQTKYALLAEYLRLFEVTCRLLRNSRIANDIRHAFTCHHRTLALDALCEFGHLIAQRADDAEVDEKNKFETIINEMENVATPELEQRLNVALVSLSLSGFYVRYVRELNRERPESTAYFETLLFLMHDLQRINSKEKLHLNTVRVLAIKGLLMCIGECMQQIYRLQSINLYVRTVPHFDIFKACSQLPLQTRDEMGRRKTDTQVNLSEYQNYLNNVPLFIERLETLQANIHEQPLLVVPHRARKK